MSDNNGASPSQDDQETVVAAENADQEVRTSNVACCCDLSTRKFASLAFNAFVFISAVIFLVAANVKTDPNGINITRLPVYRYLTVVLVISVIWMLTFILSKHFSNVVRAGRLASHIEPKKSLLPTHLLVGVMFFGLGSSFLTMVELLQFIAEYNCPRKDLTMLFYYVVRTIFIYTQLYFFYKLSRESEKLLIFGHFLTMHLIAVNLGTWIVTFVYDSAEELKETIGSKNSTLSFMARHWGNNLVESEPQKCMDTVEALRSTAEKMEPYLYTFTMEYCLISAGLMLNTWLSLRTSMETANPRNEEHVVAETGHTSSDGEGSRRKHGSRASCSQNNNHKRQKSAKCRGKERKPSTVSYGSISQSSGNDEFDTGDYVMLESHKSTEEVGTLWRFGFILGLAYVPMFVAIILNLFFTDDEKQDQLIYVGMQFFFFLSIFVASLIGVHQCRNIHKIESDSQVDFILLAVSLVGVLFLDFLIIIASICEMSDHRYIAGSLIGTNAMELVCSVMFTLFVRKALERRLPENIDKDDYAIVSDSASKIREVVSFLFMLNICFWGMYTFEVKKSGKLLLIVEQFYTEKVWFYLSHFVYPLAVFFHFHGAVCMFEVLERYSITKPPTREGSVASVSISVQANSKA